MGCSGVGETRLQYQVHFLDGDRRRNEGGWVARCVDVERIRPVVVLGVGWMFNRGLRCGAIANVRLLHLCNRHLAFGAQTGPVVVEEAHGVVPACYLELLPDRFEVEGDGGLRLVDFRKEDLEIGYRCISIINENSATADKFGNLLLAVPQDLALGVVEPSVGDGEAGVWIGGGGGVANVPIVIRVCVGHVGACENCGCERADDSAVRVFC